MWEKVKSFITNKYFLSILTIFSLILAVVFYFTGQKEIEPRYAVSEPELLAEVAADAPGLELFWEGEEINNVYSIQIVIWNAGREYIDNDIIVKTDPIRIIYPKDVKILFKKFVKYSRDTLTMSVDEVNNGDESYLEIGIIGDESLENKDGGLLQILYTGEEYGEFQVVGRVKGDKRGFTRVGWTVATRELDEYLYTFFVQPILLIFGGWTAFSIGKKGRGLGKIIGYIVGGFIFLSGLYFTLIIYFEFLPDLIRGVPWV